MASCSAACYVFLPTPPLSPPSAALAPRLQPFAGADRAPPPGKRCTGAMRGRRRQDAPARPVLDGQRLPSRRDGHSFHAAVQGAPGRLLLQALFARHSAPLLQDESMLRAHDRLGFTPLDYLRDGQIGDWAGFIDAHKELFWSPRNAPGRSPEAWCALLWPELGSGAGVSAAPGDPPRSAQISLPGRDGGASSLAADAASGGAVPRGMAALPALPHQGPPGESPATDALHSRVKQQSDPGAARRGGAGSSPVDAGVAAGGGSRRPGWGTLCFSGPK